jgi:hypothetical protein
VVLERFSLNLSDDGTADHLSDDRDDFLGYPCDWIHDFSFLVVNKLTTGKDKNQQPQTRTRSPTFSRILLGDHWKV